MAIDNKDKKVLKSSIEREQNELACSAEREKIKGSKNLNVPLLRFPEFTDEWKESVLSDFVERVKRKNKNNLCKLPLTISAQYGLVDQISFFNKVIASENMSNYYLLHKGDFAYNKSYSSEYPWGAIKRLDCYEQGTLSSLYICFKPYSHVSSDFLTHYFETSKWHQGISEIAVEGARNHGLLNVGIQDFFETRHCLPQSLLEQEKIAKFLNLIEERIATQNKIIEKYESLIKGLNNILLYGTGGKSVCLGDILLERSERSRTNNQHEVLSSTVKGIFSQREYFSKDIASENNVGYKIIRLHDVVLSPQNLWMGNINYNDRFEIGIVSPSYKVFSIADGYDNQFVAAMLKTHRALYSYMMVSEQGASIVRRNLNMEAFSQLVFKIPSLDKQREIGCAISLLKSQLKTANKLIRAYTSQKQYLLRQMFI